MKQFVVFDRASGEVQRSGMCIDESFVNQAAPDELLEGVADCFSHYVVDGQFVPYTPEQIATKRARPVYPAVWSNETFQWIDVRPIASAKLEKSTEINIARMTANQSQFMYAGKAIAADPLSRSDIDGVNGMVSLLGALPPNWVGAWKAIDNTYVPITTVAQWTAFYGAMVQQGTVNFAHAQELKAQLALADTIDEINAVVW